MTRRGYLTNDKAVIMSAQRLKTSTESRTDFRFGEWKSVQQGIHEELVRQDGIYRHFIVERREATKWRV